MRLSGWLVQASELVRLCVRQLAQSIREAGRGAARSVESIRFASESCWHIGPARYQAELFRK